MKFTLKRKVMAGAISIGLLSGVGMAFANTDAGARLQNWYDGNFNTSVATIKSDVTGYVNTLKPGLQADYNAMKNSAASKISTRKGMDIAVAEGRIDAAKTERINAVENTKNSILQGAEAAFNEELRLGFAAIEENGNNAARTAVTNLTAFTGQKGSEAINQVTSDLTAAQDRAVDELEKAVKDAKKELLDDLGSRQSATTAELKAKVDSKIAAMRTRIQGILDGLVSTQQGLITAKAQELEGQAIAALDAVVGKINE